MRYLLLFLIVACVLALIAFLSSNGPLVKVEPPPPPSLATAPRAQVIEPATTAGPGAEAAIYACEQWAGAHSKLAVGEVLDRYTVGRYPKWGALPKGQVRVGLDYRTTASGLLMEATCQYRTVASQLVLVRAESRAK